jgi:UMF1 family MFS transporter
MEKSAARQRMGWYFYDWANSAYTTSVVTVFLGPYLTSIAANGADAQGNVSALGMIFPAGSFFPYLVSISVLLQVFLLPVLGAYADYTHRKKMYMLCCGIAGALATTAMYMIHGNNFLFGGALFLIANSCYGASIVFYNAILPQISDLKQRDAVSANGFAWGYMGGGILLLLNFILFLNKESLNISTADAARICICSAGIWWLIFSFFPFRWIQNEQKTDSGNHWNWRLGPQQLMHTIRILRKSPHTLLFICAFMLYNDGVQTVISMASQFGQEEIGLSLAQLQTAILLVQFVGFFGAHMFKWIAGRLNAKNAILISLFLWIGVLLYAHGFLPKQDALAFYCLSAVIAIVLGGSQALSRSLFTTMIPEGRESEYFSLYEISDRGTSWLGPLFFGLAFQFTGSYRIAILSLIFFFFTGALLLLRVDTTRAQCEAAARG